MKCPDCGESARADLIDHDFTDKDAWAAYSCACGCEFTMVYGSAEVEIDTTSTQAARERREEVAAEDWRRHHA